MLARVRTRLLLLVGLLALALAAPAPAAVRTGPSGDAFYTPPKPLPGKAHGDPIWIRDVTNEQSLAEASVNKTILYRSTAIGGKAIAVSGTIHLPKGKAPRGGWPVVSWAHPTTGLSDQCAPSRNPGEGAIVAYHTYIEGLLDRWLAAGFAIVRTDYEGLGTKGVHPFLVGVSEGRGVLDIVRAARKTFKSVGTRVAVTGHSQGGHSAIFAAALAPKYTPELAYRGTAAFAPAAQGDEAFANIASASQPSRATGYVVAISRGLDAAYPKLRIPSLLSDRGKELFPLVLAGCVTEFTADDSEFAKTAPNAVYASGADLDPVLDVLADNDPTDLRLRTPLLVEQGTADTTVLPASTDAMVKGLRKRGAKVTYRVHQDVDHTFIAFGAPRDEVFSWVSKRLK
jgi:fermentation-respiration switch protein FrsA (DUF1100 family)